jgi:hypothetical protein
MRFSGTLEAMQARSSARVRTTLIEGLLSFALSTGGVACGTSTIHVAPDSGRRGGSDSYAAPAESGSASTKPSDTKSEAATGPKFPKCASEEAAKAKFSERTNGADYRAIVRLTIAPDGRPQDPCLLLTEGPEELEGKATAGIVDKQYNPAYAGQKRDVTVTYRYQVGEKN